MTNKHLLLLPFILLSSVCTAQQTAGGMDTSRAMRESPAALMANVAVTGFMHDFIRGASAEVLASHCAVPFSYGDSTLLTTTASLKTVLAGFSKTFMQDAQKSHPALDSLSVYGYITGVQHGIVPVNIYLTLVVIKLHLRGEEPKNTLVFPVQVGDSAKIVGMGR